MARPLYDYATGEWYEPPDEDQPQPNYGGGDLYYGTPSVPAPTAPDPEPEPTPDEPQPPAPPAPPDGGGGGGGGGEMGHQTPDTFTVSPSWPTFRPPQRPNLPEFSYDPFQQPTLEQAKNEPGYEFAREEGLRALMNANLPVLRTGGTLKNLIGWGNRFAEQNYGNVYNRAANTWNMNFGAKKDAHGLNTQNILAGYDRDFESALAQFNPNFRAAELTFSDIYNRDRDLLDALTRLGIAGTGA